VQDATTSGIWINDSVTGADICTSKTGQVPGGLGRATFIIDNTQCDSKTLTITIQPLILTYAKPF
jgi:hypothetical protein